VTKLPKNHEIKRKIFSNAVAEGLSSPGVDIEPGSTLRIPVERPGADRAVAEVATRKPASYQLADLGWVPT